MNLDSGAPLKTAATGGWCRLRDALLYEAGHSRPDVNSLANLTFLTGTTNQKVSNRDPAEYMPEYLAKHAGAVESHWMPVDPELWSIDRYHDFLAARRELLAAAANRMLDRFLSGSIDTSIEIMDIVRPRRS